MRGAIFGLGGSPAEVASRVSTIPNVSLSVCKDVAEVVSVCDSCDFLLLQQTFYRDDVARAIHGSPRVRWVQLLSTGYDTLVGEPIRPDMIVTNSGPSFAPAVADHALGLLLSLTRRLVPAAGAQAAGEWRSKIRMEAISLDARKAVVVGFGAIGQQIGRRLRAFGMNVCGVNRSGGSSAHADRMARIDDLDSLLPDADVVVLALPLTASTDRLFDATRLERMKRGALIVNIGRGNLIDTEALVDALNSGHLGGAGLDVTAPEPLPAGHRAWRAPNMVITPHYGGAGSNEALADFVVANVEAFVAGKAPASIIDHGLLQPGA